MTGKRHKEREKDESVSDCNTGFYISSAVCFFFCSSISVDFSAGRFAEEYSGTGKFFSVTLLLDEPGYYVMFWNSVKIAGGVIGGQLLLSLPAAWGFARWHFPGKKMLLSLYIVLMLFPFQILMLSEYLVLNRMGMIDTLWALILPGVCSTFPVFIMYRFFSKLSKDVIEAAKLDGANEWQIFWRIGIPLGMPGIMSVIVLDFLEYWNLIEQPAVFLRTERLKPLSLYISTITKENAGVAFVAALVALLPPLLVFLCGHRYLEQGIAAMGGGSES